MERKFKVIGLGGIGSNLVDPLARYLSLSKDTIEITLIDGDHYEERNRERQKFHRCDSKAAVTAERLREDFPTVHFRAKADYITEDNVVSIIREGDTVLMGVDNHATRKLVSDRCDELDNVVLISGGNDYTDGNVIRYVRQNGVALSKSPTELFQSIANPTDKNPGELSEAERQGCARESVSKPQLLFANLAVASHMLNVLYTQELGKADFDQVYFDILTQKSRPTPEKQFDLGDL